MMEKELKAKVKQMFSKSVPRYYEHTLSVVKNMKELIKKNVEDSKDKKILLIAAYLHDIGYSAPYRGNYVGNIKNQEIKIKVHSEVGAKIASELLREIGLEDEIIRKVSFLVSVHHRKDIDDWYLKVLLEADEI